MTNKAKFFAQNFVVCGKIFQTDSKALIIQKDLYKKQ